MYIVHVTMFLYVVGTCNEFTMSAFLKTCNYALLYSPAMHCIHLVNTTVTSYQQFLKLVKSW